MSKTPEEPLGSYRSSAGSQPWRVGREADPPPPLRNPLRRYLEAQVAHAREQASAKELARCVLKEVIFDEDVKRMKMEAPTQQGAQRRMKAEERRRIYYETDGEWLEMLKDEWVGELRLDIEANREARRLTEGGKAAEAKEAKQAAAQAKIDRKAERKEREAEGGVKQVKGEAAGAATDEEVAARAKEQADALGLGAIPPEVMAAMQAKREADALARAEADRRKKGVCVACGDEPATQSCSKCATRLYCGRECQVKHWKSHKKPCKVACAVKAAAAAEGAAK